MLVFLFLVAGVAVGVVVALFGIVLAGAIINAAPIRPPCPPRPDLSAEERRRRQRDYAEATRRARVLHQRFGGRPV